MRVLHISTLYAQPQDALPTQPPLTGFYWVSCTHSELETQLPQIQAMLNQVCGYPLVDLHVSDLLNPQLPSNYDYTSAYDVVVFRRLADTHLPQLPTAPPAAQASHRSAHTAASGDSPVLQRVETRPIGFALYDQLLLSVHPEECLLRSAYWQKLLTAPSASDTRPVAVKLPTEPADLMLRMVNAMVDGYLDLRRSLTRQIDHWQLALLKPNTRFTNWASVLDVRLALHQLDEICEDQRAAIQDWTEALEGWPPESTPVRQRERELLTVRSRDVLEHIERVTHHIRRMEQSAEAAVQMHFSAQSNRANDIMRTLTTVTAIFLPLNLIAAVFGMNFEFIPFVHKKDGFIWAMASMVVITLVLVGYFWRRRYLESEEQP
ncbi:magnesium transporter [Comamonas phosphati]|nr:magnesium transporter [Comamonas phosphati]